MMRLSLPVLALAFRWLLVAMEDACLVSHHRVHVQWLEPKARKAVTRSVPSDLPLLQAEGKYELSWMPAFTIEWQ